MIWTLAGFEQACTRLNQALEEEIDSLGESLTHWELVEEGGNRRARFLARRHQVSLNSVLDDHDATNTTAQEDESSNDSTTEYILGDADCVVPEAAQHDKYTTNWEWHFSVVYSETWHAPVLYFHVQDMKRGEPCTRSQIVTYLSNLYPQNKVEDTWDFCSQEEHPITRMPSFFLHPCRTNERLQHLTTPQEHKQDPAATLLQWMTIMLPSVGLAIGSSDFVKVTARLKVDTASRDSTEKE